METALNLNITGLGQVTNTISNVIQNNDFENVVKIVKKEPSVENDANTEVDLIQPIPSDLVEVHVNIKEEPDSEDSENENFEDEFKKSRDSIKVEIEYKDSYSNINDGKQIVPIYDPRVVPSTSTSILPGAADHESGTTPRRSTRNKQSTKIDNTFAESKEGNNGFQKIFNTSFNDVTHSFDDKAHVLSDLIDNKNLTNLEHSLLTGTNKKTQDLIQSPNAKQKKKRGRGQKLSYKKHNQRSEEYIELKKQRTRDAHRKKRNEMKRLEEHIREELNNLGFPELISRGANMNTFVFPPKSNETTDNSIEHTTNGLCNVNDDKSLQDQISRLMAEWEKILEYRARVRDHARNRRKRLREKGNKRQLEEYRAKCRAYMRKKRANQEFRELEKHRDKIKARERRQRRNLIDELIQPGSGGLDRLKEKNNDNLEILQQINFSSANIQSGLLAALNHKLSRPQSKQEELAKTYERRNNNPEYKRQSRINRLQRYFGFPGLVRGRKRCSLCSKYFEIAYDIVQIKKQRAKGNKNIVLPPKKRGRPKKETADGANSKEMRVNDHENASCDEDSTCSDYTLGTLDKQLRKVQYDLEVKCTCQFRDIPEDKPEVERNAIRKIILSKQIEVVREQISGIKIKTENTKEELKSNFSFRDKEREKAKRRSSELRKRKFANSGEDSQGSVLSVSDDSETGNTFHNVSNDGTGDFHHFLFQKVDIGTLEASTSESQTDPIGIGSEFGASIDADALSQPGNSAPVVVEASPITSLGIEYVKKRREAERKKKARQRKEARIQQGKKSQPECASQGTANTALTLHEKATGLDTAEQKDDVSVEPPKVIVLEFD